MKRTTDITAAMSVLAQLKTRQNITIVSQSQDCFAYLTSMTPMIRKRLIAIVKARVDSIFITFSNQNFVIQPFYRDPTSIFYRFLTVQQAGTRLCGSIRMRGPEVRGKTAGELAGVASIRRFSLRFSWVRAEAAFLFFLEFRIIQMPNDISTQYKLAKIPKPPKISPTVHLQNSIKPAQQSRPAITDSPDTDIQITQSHRIIRFDQLQTINTNRQAKKMSNQQYKASPAHTKYTHKYAIPTNIPPQSYTYGYGSKGNPMHEYGYGMGKLRDEDRGREDGAEGEEENQNTLARLLMFESGELGSRDYISAGKIGSSQHNSPYEANSSLGQDNSLGLTNSNAIKYVHSRYEPSSQPQPQPAYNPPSQPYIHNTTAYPNLSNLPLFQSEYQYRPGQPTPLNSQPANYYANTEMEKLELSEDSRRGQGNRDGLRDYDLDSQGGYRLQEDSSESEDMLYSFIVKLVDVLSKKIRVQSRYAFQALYMNSKYKPFIPESKPQPPTQLQPLPLATQPSLQKTPSSHLPLNSTAKTDSSKQKSNYNTYTYSHGSSEYNGNKNEAAGNGREGHHALSSISSIEPQGNHSVYAYNVSTSINDNLQYELPKRKHIFTIEDTAIQGNQTYPYPTKPLPHPPLSPSPSHTHGHYQHNILPTFNKIIEQQQEESNANTNSNIVANGHGLGNVGEFQFNSNLRVKSRSKRFSGDAGVAVGKSYGYREEEAKGYSSEGNLAYGLRGYGGETKKQIPSTAIKDIVRVNLTAMKNIQQSFPKADKALPHQQLPSEPANPKIQPLQSTLLPSSQPEVQPQQFQTPPMTPPSAHENSNSNSNQNYNENSEEMEEAEINQLRNQGQGEGQGQEEVLHLDSNSKNNGNYQVNNNNTGNEINRFHYKEVIQKNMKATPTPNPPVSANNTTANTNTNPTTTADPDGQLEGQPQYINVGQPLIYEKLILKPNSPANNGSSLPRPTTSYIHGPGSQPSLIADTVSSDVRGGSRERPLTHKPAAGEAMASMHVRPVSNIHPPVNFNFVRAVSPTAFHANYPQIVIPPARPEVVLNRNQRQSVPIRITSQSPPGKAQRVHSQNSPPLIKIFVQKKDPMPQPRKIFITYNNNPSSQPDQPRRPVSQPAPRPISSLTHVNSVESIPTAVMQSRLENQKLGDVRADYYGHGTGQSGVGNVVINNRVVRQTSPVIRECRSNPNLVRVNFVTGDGNRNAVGMSPSHAYNINRASPTPIITIPRPSSPTKSQSPSKLPHPQIPRPQSSHPTTPATNIKETTQKLTPEQMRRKGMDQTIINALGNGEDEMMAYRDKDAVIQGARDGFFDHRHFGRKDRPSTEGQQTAIKHQLANNEYLLQPETSSFVARNKMPFNFASSPKISNPLLPINPFALSPRVQQNRPANETSLHPIYRQYRDANTSRPGSQGKKLNVISKQALGNKNSPGMNINFKAI